MKVTIYTCHHKPSAFLEGNVFKPLHVGKANSYNDIGCEGDDSGENISFKNPYYCELTAQYWMWKNDIESDYIGLMHYRRHLSFAEDDFQEDQWGVVVEKTVNRAYQEKHGLVDAQVLEGLDGVDVILPRKWDVRNAGSRNNYDHYKKSPDLFINDYQAAINILLNKHPEYYDAVKEYNDSPYGYYTNMFVMKKYVFDRYSSWLFEILDELEQEVSLADYSQQQCRVFGHISERLLGIYFLHELRRNDLVVKEALRTFVKTETFNGHIEPAFPENNLPIVICFDDNYSHSGGALIQTIINKASRHKNYDILVLENGVSQKNKKRLVSLIEGSPNFSLRFFDVKAFDEIKDVHTRAHFSPATYARLFIPRVFRTQDRVLFIDADTVVNDDVAKLFELDIGKNLVAAVKDIVMEGFVRYGTVSDQHTGAMEAKYYLKDYLGLDDIDGYFQAGLILFNLSQMHQENTYKKLIDALLERPYWFLDQDIMNRVFQGRIYYLPMSWNVFHGNGNTFEFFPGLKFATFSEFLESRKKPSMIHFAGDQKPWNNPSVDFAEMYWNSLRNTPWYEERVNNLVTKRLHDKKVVREYSEIRQSIEERFRSFLKPYVKPLLPVGSYRRRLAILLYFRSLSSYRKLKSILMD